LHYGAADLLSPAQPGVITEDLIHPINCLPIMQETFSELEGNAEQFSQGRMPLSETDCEYACPRKLDAVSARFTKTSIASTARRILSALPALAYQGKPWVSRGFRGFAGNFRQPLSGSGLSLPHSRINIRGGRCSPAIRG
jgi:hypothetical protein